MLVRVEFNVPIEQGKVVDDFRLRQSLPTIRFLKGKGAKIILMAHLGRPEGKRNPGLSLEPVAKHLETLLKIPVRFSRDELGEAVERRVAELKDGEIMLLENLRFYPEEETNGWAFAARLARLGDFYVNDAFGVSHRAHASVEAITHFLPSYAGLLLEKEVETLSRVYSHPQHPMAVIMGGAKVETKLKMLLRFFSLADHIMLGGIIANTILSAKGVSVGSSKVDEEVGHLLEGFDLTSTKVHVPVDVIVSKDMSGDSSRRVLAPGIVEPPEMILDIGPDTVREYSEIIAVSRLLVWNGPMGYIESKAFQEGTVALARAFGRASGFRVVGGGEVISVLDKMDILGTIDYVSTGGGAMLEFLAGEKLPGIEALG